MTYRLPFVVMRACRSSFVVNIDGDVAFITNENLFYMMEHPDAQFDIVPKRDSRGLEQNWIIVAKVVWDFGFKPKKFDCNGRTF